jgi:hypothetical protein
MRWRGTVRAMARLRTSMPAERLTTLRYEQMIRQPGAAVKAVSRFIDGELAPINLRDLGRTAVGPQAMQPGAWRGALNAQQLKDIEQVAGADLSRVGYGS